MESLTQDQDHKADKQSCAVSSSEAFVDHHDFAPDSELRSISDSGTSSPTPPVKPRLDTVVAVDNSGTTLSQTPSVRSSYSAASDRQLGHGSQGDPNDRVFPIRSVVSVDPSNRPNNDQGYFPRMSESGGRFAPRPPHSRSDTETPIRRHGSIMSDSVLSPSGVMSPAYSDSRENRRRTNTAGARSSVQADADRQGSAPLPIFSNDASDGEESEMAAEPPSAYQSSAGRETPGIESALDGLMTTRFKHVTTDDGHLVITGRDGTIQRCEDEPIHTPGAVQGFGLLLAIREEADGRFTVRYASENSKRIIGYSPLQLFRLSNFTDILTEEQADNLLDHVDFIRDEDADPSVNGPEVFSMSIRPPKKR